MKTNSRLLKPVCDHGEDHRVICVWIIKSGGIHEHNRLTVDGMGASDGLNW
jgi:hypothetical protein